MNQYIIQQARLQNDSGIGFMQKVILLIVYQWLQLRRSFQISDEVMHNLLEDMDLLSRRFRYQPTNHG